MKRLTVVMIAFVLVAAIWYLSRAPLRLAAIVENERWLRGVIADDPIVSISVGMLVYIITSLIPGTTGKSIVFGWLFGFWIGLAIVSLSLTVAAMIAMSTVRHFFRDWAVRRAKKSVNKIDAALKRGGEATCLMTLRLVHAPYTGINYSAGATDVRLSTFAWTTLLGMLPSNMVFVLAGSRLPTLDRFDRIKPWAIVDWNLLFASTLAIAIPLLVKRFFARASDEAACRDGDLA